MAAAQDEIQKCPVCNCENVKLWGLGPLNQVYYVDCPQCGKYKIDSGLNPFSTDKEKSYLISAWIREQNEKGKTPEINSSNFERLQKIPIPSVSEKQLYLIQALEKRTEYRGARVDVTSPAFIALAWCKNRQELLFYLKSLDERELLKTTLKSDQISVAQTMITAKGWDFLEANKHKGREESRKVFVAMSFDKSMDSAFDAICDAVEKTKYKLVRIDRVEHIDKIDDRIIAEIKSSKFLIADLTGHRNGVYYEAGFAQGHNIPVIWCVRKDDLEKAHFDIRQFNCIVWENEEDLKEKLINRIKAVID
jgi:nucleoside 2-deoxyribosyltransferase